tara:strand:+ start:199 stop:651 length:453 start_codon:yes stop_codon:yes gene_type:complete
MNITEITNNTISSTLFNCEDLTNNGLYMIFIGYLYPMLSPTIRNYIKDMFINIKNVGKITGQVVSLTEFGFSKLQGIKSNEDMIKFIERICNNKNMKITINEIKECAWSFSGDTDNGKKPNMEQSWNKLLNELDRLHTLNNLNKSVENNA